MEHSLNILQNILRLKIKETVVDYRISYDITGKVYKVYPLIFELPKVARQLIIGKTKEEMANKIPALGCIIQLILPLGIVHQLPFLTEELKDIVGKIDKEIEQQGIVKNNLYQLAEKDSLAFYILSYFNNPSLYPHKYKAFWEQIIFFLRDKDEEISYDHIYMFKYHTAPFGFKALTLLLPFIGDTHTKENL